MSNLEFGRLDSLGLMKEIIWRFMREEMNALAESRDDSHNEEESMGLDEVAKVDGTDFDREEDATAAGDDERETLLASSGVGVHLLPHL